MKNKIAYFIGFIFLSCIVCQVAFAGASSAVVEQKYAGVPSVSQSNAFRQYMARPRTELSRLIYLVDRLAESNIQIKYDDIFYPSLFAAHVSRIFIAGHYKNETAKGWVTRWCSGTITSGKPIWVKFKDDNYKVAKDVLFEELDDLDKRLETNPATAVNNQKASPAPSSSTQ